MDLQLQDKVALVTGGSKGIGAGIVRGLLAEGAKVANVNRSSAEGRALEAEFREVGRECAFIQADLCEAAACRQAVAAVIARFGRIDILVNNAGANDGVSLEAGPEAFVTSLQRNLIHYYLMVHYALEPLKESAGVIVNIGSKVAETGQGGTSGYAAAKGGINALTREWAVELAPYSIRANAVIPAEVWTPLYARWLATMPEPERTKQQIENLVPFEQRFTTVAEIADTVIFLASPRSSHTTGQIVYVDGGYSHLDRKATSPVL